MQGLDEQVAVRRCGLDVYEDEPNMTPGLSDCENVVVVPHIASASLWTRSGMVSPTPHPILPTIHAHIPNHRSRMWH